MVLEGKRAVEETKGSRVTEDLERTEGLRGDREP